MIKHPRSRYDKLFTVAHRYFVYASITVTVISTGFLGVTYYHHWQHKRQLRANPPPPKVPTSELN